MVIEVDGTVAASERRLDEVTQQIAAHFQPEQIFLLGGRVTGRGEWLEVDLLIVLPGEWDYREKCGEIQARLDGARPGKFIYLSTPAQFAQRRAQRRTEEHRALHDGRLLYERQYAEPVGSAPLAR